ncbi:MAG: sulfatase-like hydrolase/transferase [Planctomycetes bacterium]|nr:sulfatase-like hydrolase/transferase [Planctomycetota bacterium]
MKSLSRRIFLKTTAAVGTGISILSSTQAKNSIAPEKSKKPNIVFFFVDDMGWQDTSEPFHTEITKLNQRYYTPNMERLADEGLKFTQAYACSLCSPSRVSLMTGLNSYQHNVTNWTLRPNKSPDSKHPTLNPPKWNLNGMSPMASGLFLIN